jgi:hypothetical protein
MMLFAGAFQARPERIGKTNESTSFLPPCWIEAYKLSSTVRGDSAVGRYAGYGVGRGFLAFKRSSPEGKVDMMDRISRS